MYIFIFSYWKEFYFKLNKLNVNYTDESIESMIYDCVDDMKKGIHKYKSHTSSRLAFYKCDKSDTEYLYPIISHLLVIIINSLCIFFFLYIIVHIYF